MFKRILVLLSLALLLPAADIVTNGSFINGFESWNKWGSPEWSLHERGVSGQAILLTGPKTAGVAGITQSRVPLQPGKEYRLCFSLNLSSRSAQGISLLGGLLERDDKGKAVRSTFKPIPLSPLEDWVKYTVDLKTSETPCAYYQLVIRFNNMQPEASMLISAVNIQEVNNDPEAAANRLREITAAAAGYARRTARTGFFSRAQLKYGLEQSDYIHRWIDRPLFTNPGLQRETSKKFLNPGSYAIMHGILGRYLLDGFAFFPETARREELYEVCRTPGLEIGILTEFIESNSDMTKKIQYARMALENPSSFRINGKVVFTSYPQSNNIDYWVAVKKAVTEALGDHFIFMPFISFFPPNFQPTGPNGEFGALDYQMLQERTRLWLRAVDGYYHNSPAVKERRYHAAFDRDIVIPILHSVLQEPEFRGKYLGWGIKVGHENIERLGYTTDSFGTDFLRGSLGTALLAQADFINCVEWDEQNENTSFRPTLYNSTSTQRIVRHMISELNAGQPAPVLPGDNLATPNLILSYRKTLAAGQILELEVVNVPDPGLAGDLRFTLALQDLSGKNVKTFPEQRLPADKLNAALLTCPAEELLASHVLLPVLTVTRPDGTTYRSPDAFQPIELRASWNWDFKWVKQPLRELLPVTAASLKILEKRADGTLLVQATLEAAEPLAHLEIIDSGDVTFTLQDEADFQESADTVAIHLGLQSTQGDTQKVNGRIVINNAPSLRSAAPGARQAVRIKDNVLTYTNGIVGHWPQEVYLAIPRAEAANASITFALEGIADRTLAVTDILALQALAFPGKNGLNLTVRRQVLPPKMPVHLERPGATFTALIAPASPNSVLHLQAVTQSGRLYRGQTLDLYQPAGTTGQLDIFSRSTGTHQRLSVDRQLLTDISYTFTPEHGSVLATPAGRDFLGLGGGAPAMVGGRGLGAGQYSNPMLELHPSQWHENRMQVPSAPAWQQLPDGNWALLFAGHNFLSLPRALIPPFAGFHLTLEIRPDSLENDQALLSNTFTGFQLEIKQGIPQASTFMEHRYKKDDSEGEAQATAKGAPLTAGKWHKIEVVFNQRQLWIVVDGEAGQPVAASGNHLFTRPFVLGVDGKKGNFFHGAMRQLHIRHQAE